MPGPILYQPKVKRFREALLDVTPDMKEEQIQNVVSNEIGEIPQAKPESEEAFVPKADAVESIARMLAAKKAEAELPVQPDMEVGQKFPSLERFAELKKRLRQSE
jgi:hypothetical protein